MSLVIIFLAILAYILGIYLLDKYPQNYFFKALILIALLLYSIALILLISSYNHKSISDIETKTYLTQKN